MGKYRDSTVLLTNKLLICYNFEQTLWLLAKDQESQDRLRAEVGPLFAENPRPDYRSLKDLPWLDCVVFVSPYTSLIMYGAEIRI